MKAKMQGKAWETMNVEKDLSRNWIWGSNLDTSTYMAGRALGLVI